MTNAKIKSWEYQIESGNLQHTTAKVLHCIKNHPNITIDEIQERLNIRYSSCTGAISILADEGVIDVTGDKQVGNYNGSSRIQSQWIYVSDVNEQVRLQEKRQEERFKRYLDSMPNFLNRLDEIEKEVQRIREGLSYVPHRNTTDEGDE